MAESSFDEAQPLFHHQNSNMSDPISIHVSYGRGLHTFTAAEQWTVGMLRASVCTTRDLEVPLSERPRPPPMWSGASMVGKVIGFVREYRSYDLGAYTEDELLADDTVIAEGPQLYLVTDQ